MNTVSLPFVSKCFYAYEHFNHTKQNILLVFFDEESSIKAFKQMQFFCRNTEQENNVLFFPSLDTVPYDRVSPSSEIQAARAKVLTSLSQSKSAKIVITAAANLLIRVPEPTVFSMSTLLLYQGLDINIEEVILFLVTNGFSRSSTAIDNGEFAVRGEILDIVTSGGMAYRINFGWERIESIKEYDANTQISTRSVKELELSSASESLLNEYTINVFKQNFLRIFGVNHITSPLYNAILNGNKFQGYEHLMPLFFHNTVTLTNYLDQCTIIYDNLSIQAIKECAFNYQEFYEARLESNKFNPNSFYYAIRPEMLILNVDELESNLQQGNSIFFGSDETLAQTEYKEAIYQTIPKISTTATIEKKSVFDSLFDLIVKHRKLIPVIFCTSKSGIERIKQTAQEREYICTEISTLKDAKKNFINLTIAPLSVGFKTEKFLFISEQDILGEKFTSLGHKSSKRKLQNILNEIDNIDQGELIIHKEHGIGRFERIETITVQDIEHDCLKIIYADNDILYLPVENIDVIKKYGNDDAELDKLGGGAWQKRKAKFKQRIKDIAEKLMKICAQRALSTTNPIEFNLAEYEKFCHKFPYTETEDQLAAVNDVLEDLRSGKLMDRLICGDVGFGKTEVAMRAAYMAACDLADDTPQVAIITPTTILCKQHYENFTERFRGLGIKIVQISRLVKPKQLNENKLAINDGSAQIIIGTHALLAKSLNFKNLKLIIVDEEQHFGVTQKERLKELKAQVHNMSLSATPIPRTLQMSMVGIKDLSIIATPPIDRLPVRTSVLPFDAVVIRDALMRERFRGGRSFYVCPRIKDIEWVQAKLKDIVPELSFKIAHGQMPAAAIDEIMSEFCDGKFDILLSTTIIESGIDIAAANTIIIHRADMLGLSQLYQLRGRVGRGKVRGYAYLTLSPNQIITKHSMQRLEVLQNIDSLGAGFTIASHDMDMRGFGNLVGEEQSGHIREVGTELYNEMLEEAILELKNSGNIAKKKEFNPSINLGLPVFIPAMYVEDSALRLALYRRVADLRNDEELENFKNEMIDRFGLIPPEFNNLLEIVKVKNRCYKIGIESIDSGPNGFVIKFNKNFDVSNIVMIFVQNHPRHAKIKPDNKLVYICKLDPINIMDEAQKLLSKFEL